MNSRAYCQRKWRNVHSELGPGTSMVSIQKGHYPHPRDAGARTTVSWPVGQLADYALDLGGGLAPLLIREFADRYEVFVAGLQLTSQLIRYVEEHPQRAACVGGVLLGAAIGTAITGKREGAMLGAGVGMLVAAVIQGMIVNQRDDRLLDSYT